MKELSLSDAELLAFFGVDPKQIEPTQRVIRQLLHSQHVRLGFGEPNTVDMIYVHTPAQPTAHVIVQTARDLATYTGRTVNVDNLKGRYGVMLDDMSHVAVIARPQQNFGAFAVMPMHTGIMMKVIQDHPNKADFARVLGTYGYQVKYPSIGRR